MNTTFFMNRHITLSVDIEIKKLAHAILKENGQKLSWFFNQKMKELISQNKKLNSQKN